MTAQTTPRPRSADDLAADFYARGLDGKWLTAKQAHYLIDLFRRNVPGYAKQARYGNGGDWANGVFTATDGRNIGWELTTVHGGAGIFHTRDLDAIDVEQQRQEQLRDINIRVADLLRAGRRDEAVALLEEARPLMEAVR